MGRCGRERGWELRWGLREAVGHGFVGKTGKVSSVRFVGVVVVPQSSWWEGASAVPLAAGAWPSAGGAEG